MNRHRLSARPEWAVVALAGLLAAAGCGYVVRDTEIFVMKVNAQLAGRDIEIEIDKSFIEKYKDRVNIETSLVIDRSMREPNSRLFDADLHFAGRSPAIRLPVVAEIANAASVRRAVDLVHRLEGTGRPVKISGVWRLWAEHAGRGQEKQGEDLDPERHENPDHVFEIHPVTKLDDIRLLDTFRTIGGGFKAGEARHTFGIFQDVGCRITNKPGSVALVTRKGVDNNVEFVLEVADGRQIEVEGGRFVLASVRDLKGDLVVERLRMVFADDTPPERAVKRLKPGGRLRVFGLPRISLSEVWKRIQGSTKDPSLLEKNLPYEIIIQGVYEDRERGRGEAPPGRLS